jgi:hypothetical protein
LTDIDLSVWIGDPVDNAQSHLPSNQYGRVRELIPFRVRNVNNIAMISTEEIHGAQSWWCGSDRIGEGVASDGQDGR